MELIVCVCVCVCEGGGWAYFIVLSLQLSDALNVSGDVPLITGH